MSAIIIANRAAQLAIATESWKTLTPSAGAILDVLLVADALVHDLTVLSDADLAGSLVGNRHAGAMAMSVADASRAMHSLTAGFRNHLPDKHALSSAQRLSLTLRRALIALQTVLKERPNE
jgi:hypothetical protein